MTHHLFSKVLDGFDKLLHLGRRLDNWWFSMPRLHWIKGLIILGIGLIMFLIFYLPHLRKEIKGRKRQLLEKQLREYLSSLMLSTNTNLSNKDVSRITETIIYLIEK